MPSRAVPIGGTPTRLKAVSCVGVRWIAVGLGAKRLIDHAVHQLMRAGWGELATSRSQVRLDFLFNQANDRIRNWARPGCFRQTPGRGRNTSRADKNRRNNSAETGSAVNNPAFPDFGNLWRDLLRQWEDAGNSLGTDAMKSPEFSKFMNQATSSSAALQRVFADLSASIWPR